MGIKLVIAIILLAFNATSVHQWSPASHAGTSPVANSVPQQPTGDGRSTLPDRRQNPSGAKKGPVRRPDVIYYPTPEETVTEMLRLANIKEGDVLYDLGSGDGRIPIAAAKRYGIRAVGIEIDPKLVRVARVRAQDAGVSSLVSFRNADMFRTDLSRANIVTLYLSNRINLLLRPKLLRELRPGSRIVSHDFHMGDWEADQSVRVPWQNGLYRTVYVWTVPARTPAKKGRNVNRKSATKSVD